MRNVIVVGASAAGLSAAESLRRLGYDGRLEIIGAEVHPPYDRPPLSKQVLRGLWEPDRLALRDAQALDRIDADWHLGVRAEGLDVECHKVTLSDGQVLGYDGLVIATGVRPRRLPFGAGLAGVHVLRDIGDTLALRSDLQTARHLVIVGAGFVGTEAAAVARDMGVAVTLVDPVDKPLAALLGDRVAAKLRQVHVDHEARLVTGVGVTGFKDFNGRVTGVELGSGEVVACDVVLVGIGAIPATDWLSGSGLRIDNGVVCDEYCRAAPDVVAAGDVARWAHPEHGLLRVEHRLHATEQGAAAAATLLGQLTPFAPVPYFWTDQYDIKIQAYGHTGADLELRVVDGDISGDRFAALYGDGRRVVGALTWNMAKSGLRLRAEIVSGAPW